MWWNLRSIFVLLSSDFNNQILTFTTVLFCHVEEALDYLSTKKLSIKP